jgi:hypothetical protein
MEKIEKQKLKKHLRILMIFLTLSMIPVTIYWSWKNKMFVWWLQWLLTGVIVGIEILFILGVIYLIVYWINDNT